MEMLEVKVWVFGYLLAVLFVYAAAAEQVTDPIEVKALRAIKGAFKDPMKHLQSWDNGDPCSSNWLGVWCFDSIGSDGYVHVQQLQMLNLNLSDSLSPEVGRLSQLLVIDLMWNNISGSIPKEIGYIASLQLLLLNGNQFSGSLPDEIGLLTNLLRLQLDENQLSGLIPISFANLTSLRHLHLNNNSLSGQIPHELSRLPYILHMLVDNNNLSGYLPPEFSESNTLRILQLDNNRFDEAEIPASYGSTKLFKLSLRNCSLRGVIPDLSGSQELFVVDLSWNRLTGSLPSSKLSGHMTTIDLSNNNLNGSIPASFSELPNLQRLSLWNNSLSGSVPSTLWRNKNVSSVTEFTLDLQNNLFSNTSGDINPPKNVTLRLRENPLCNNANTNLVQFCESVADDDDMRTNLTVSSPNCAVLKCPADYYLVYSPPSSPGQCFCAAPFSIAYRLKSPSFSYFAPYESSFIKYMAESLKLKTSQISVYSYGWDEGPRLWMNLTLFLLYDNSSIKLNKTEVRRIKGIFTTWSFPQSDTFGPYDLLDYPNRRFPDSSKVRLSKGALAGLILGIITISSLVTAIIAIIIVRKHYNSLDFRPRKHLSARISVKVDGLKGFTLKELVQATENFNSLVIGEGGYGKVYRGVLTDQTIVAVKRAQVGSLQGEKEFLTEIEFLSRLHHRNLVGLLGYCDEEGEQILVYEFMANGSLRDWLCGNPIIPFASKGSLSFPMRLRISLGSAKGILYLHTEANPPIFHRDIKASNILLDSRLTAKVADFGLSRLAPVADDEGDLPGHISTVVRGTPGYLDPEYFLTHKLTDKSDVYSLGVVFLELLTGMRPISCGKNIVREVNVAHKAGNIFSIVDSKMGSYPSEVLAEFISLALKCCEDRPEARPSMSEVVRDLEKMLSMVQESSNTVSELESDFSDRSILPPTSSSTLGEPRSQNMSSSDIYGSDLISGVIPNITPR